MSGGFFFDIQFFAQERTEPATPRKRTKEREEGRVAKSKDLDAAVVILVALVAVYVLASIIWGRLGLMFEVMFEHLSSPLMNESGWWTRPLLQAVGTYAIVWMPLGFICVFFAILILVYQVGFVVSFKPFAIKFDRFNPIKGLKKIISMKTLVELAKGILKALVLLGFLVVAFMNESDLLITIMRFPLDEGAVVLMERIWDLALRMALVLLIIALADFAYQKWDFEKSIKMSKQEVKEEFKQMEGDPLV